MGKSFFPVRLIGHGALDLESESATAIKHRLSRARKVPDGKNQRLEALTLGVGISFADAIKYIGKFAKNVLYVCWTKKLTPG